MLEEFCANCGALRGPGDWVCVECHCDVWTECLSGHLVGNVPTPDPLRSAVWGLLAGRLFMAPGTVGLLAGPPGVGKSTAAFSLFGRPWWASREMSAIQVSDYVKRIGARVHGVGPVAEAEDGGDGRPLVWFPGAVEEDPDHPRDLVVDSVSACRFPMAVLEAAQDYARRYERRVLLIGHYTKANQIAGQKQLEHECDHVVTMEFEGQKKRVTIRKSRGGPGWSGLYVLGKDGVYQPRRRGYFSIEGPPYRMTKHPTPAARFAEVLKLAEKDEDLRNRLPPPPLAVCALRSELYPGGWTEPEDLDERLRFAEQQAIPHWSPVSSAEQGEDYGETPEDRRS